MFRITRVAHNLWAVRRPGSAIDHAFDQPADAERFVRHEAAGTPVTVEIHIDGLYVAAHLDVNRPPLFSPGKS